MTGMRIGASVDLECAADLPLFRHRVPLSAPDADVSFFRLDGCTWFTSNAISCSFDAPVVLA